jgi:spore coat protein CotF
MPSLINTLLGKENAQQSDQVIANSALAAVKASAMAYLTATLESATPELRRLYGEYMAQSITGHESLIQLSVNKGWYKPYDAPENQLQASFSQSQQVINEAKQ